MKIAIIAIAEGHYRIASTNNDSQVICYINESHPELLDPTEIPGVYMQSQTKIEAFLRSKKIIK